MGVYGEDGGRGAGIGKADAVPFGLGAALLVSFSIVVRAVVLGLVGRGAGLLHSQAQGARLWAAWCRRCLSLGLCHVPDTGLGGMHPLHIAVGTL
jgi:hypothetical protein